ncbi:MAG: ketoacyl-ACP synthase III [Roseburia sp.]|nr:ketoacyl-ACP synthase III [Roseburia sp.]MCM1279048.1 ketoacyl-ACP synthase III [Robinsoniella sp.]
MTIKIIGTGRCLPGNIVTNDDLSKIMDTSDEWIASRTGIRKRHIAKEETTATMSAEAAKRALQQSGLSPEEINLIIVGTITGDYVTPSTACEVQRLIGADNAVAFDINAACSGFMFALNTAYVYLQSGIYKNALIIGAETLSKIMDWNDRSTSVLFGDGAGAAVVTKGDTGLLSFTQGSDGAKGMVLACKNRSNNNPLISTSKELGYTYMDGQEVYKFAVSKVPESIRKVLAEANLEPDDIAYFILHQANIRIIQSVAKRLKVSEEKFPISLDHCGNISAGSVPILLDEVNEKGMLKKGDKIVMAGFGAGLTWSACVMEW